MRALTIAALLATLAPFSTATAQFRASLVADIEPGSGPSVQTQLPSEVAVVGNKAFYGSGLELHAADLASGTWIPLLNSSQSFILAAAGNRMLARSGDTLWTSDGTRQGTLTLPIPLGDRLDPILSTRDRAFFVVRHFGRTSRLWASDGTKSGTQELARTDARHAIPWGQRMVFTASSGEPWISDGTPVGTQRIAPLGQSRGFTVVGNRLFFVANDSSAGAELFFSDGTANGTRLVMDLVPGPQSSSPTQIGAIGNRALFNAVRPAALYITDGYPAGTRHVTDLPSPQTSGTAIESMVSMGPRVFFTWATANHGRELWTSDGTAAGTRMVRDIDAGTGSSDPRNLVVHNGRVLFTARDATRGREVWTSDGTATGTRVLREFGPGSFDGLVRIVTTNRGQVLLAAINVSGGNAFELWGTDGTPSGTRRVVRDPRRVPNSAKYGPFATTSDGRAFFAATTKSTGEELWVTDGTPNGTKLVVDLVPGTGSSSPIYLQTLRHRIAFSANTTGGYDWWISDGTAAGTVRLSTLFPANSVQSGAWFQHRDRLWLERSDPTRGRGLWETDGTRSGTRFVSRLPAGKIVLAHSTRDAVVVGVATAGPTVTLYRVDTRGTQRLAALVIRNWFSWRDNLFFYHLGSRGVELWACDGTPEGTRPFHGFGPAPINDLHAFIVDAEDHFYLHKHRDEANLWISDGTEAGTRQFKYELGHARHGVSFGRRMLFAQSTALGWTPWITDGTTGGTHQIRTTTPGERLTVHQEIRAAAPLDATHALFSGFTPFTGHELWITDGTSAGTRLIQELAPGAASSSPEFVANLPSGSLFLATHPVHGRSLWRIDGLAGSRRIEAGCNGGASRTPQLTGTGSPVLGGRFALDLKHGARHAPGLLMVGEHPGSFPLGGYCRLVLDPNRIGATVPITTDHQGRASIPFNIPANAWLHGRQLLWQAAITVTGNPPRLSLTNGLATALSAW